MYKEKITTWRNEIMDLEIKLSALNKAGNDLIDNCIDILELCQNAHQYWKERNEEGKKMLLNILCSNFYYDGANLDIECKLTHGLSIINTNIENWGGKIRTYLALICSIHLIL